MADKEIYRVRKSWSDTKSQVGAYTILENAKKACKKAGADYVKTSTGFSTGGATVSDIALMRKTVGPDLGVKASGGVRSYEDMVNMVEAGATRIGTSSGPKLMK